MSWTINSAGPSTKARALRIVREQKTHLPPDSPEEEIAERTREMLLEIVRLAPNDSEVTAYVVEARAAGHGGTVSDFSVRVTAHAK